MDFYVNGKTVKAERAVVSAQDAGFQHGIGLFETMATFHGRIFRLKQHLDRLADAAEALGLARELNRETLVHAVEDTIAANKLDKARLRLTLTPGPVSLLAAPEAKPVEPTVLVTASLPTVYDPEYFTNGISVVIAGPMANPFDPTSGRKTLNYWQRLRTLRQAASLGAGEAIWLNVTNHLASGAVSNLFLVKDGGLLTPFARGEEVSDALPAPVLPGVTRAVILELAERLDIPVNKRMLSIEDLLEADEVFLTNSSWQVLPVTKVEKKTIGEVGPMTLRLREALLNLIEQETQADAS